MPRVVVASQYGRLGNRLLSFSNLVSASVSQGFEVWNPGFWPYAGEFVGTARGMVARFPEANGGSLPFTARRLAGAYWRLRERQAQVRPRSGELVIDLKLGEQLDLNGSRLAEALATADTIFVRGLELVDLDGFSRNAGVVREFFRPIPEREKRARNLADRARAGREVLIGVHIRRGDYRTAAGGQWFFGNDTYCAVMGSVKSMLAPATTSFLVMSDEPESVRGLEGDGTTVSHECTVVDMHALSLCDRIVGPPSSFSTWASIMGGVPLMSLEEPTPRATEAAFTVCKAFFTALRKTGGN